MVGPPLSINYGEPRLQISRFFFFLKISKEIGKACRKSLREPHTPVLASLPRSRSLFSASFQTFCLTARALRTWIRKNTDCLAVYSEPHPDVNRLQFFSSFVENR